MKIVILGGGSAGWISALLIQKSFPEHNITVIENTEIGILGAGEGTVSNFNGFLNSVDIDIIDFIKETKSVIKNGVKFVNWNSYQKDYFLGFNYFTGEVLSSLDNFLFSINNDLNLEDTNFYHKLSEQNKIPIEKNNINLYLTDKTYREKIAKRFAWHFDASLLAKYFRKVGIERGINTIDVFVKDFVADENNNIVKLITDKNDVIDCDFLIDCSGFKRLVIGKFYKEEWIDYSSLLPADSTVVFFPEKDENLPPYTEIEALKYGWLFRIPLQHRFGSGYVYSSQYISEEEAIKELKEKFGENIQIMNRFKFNAGHYKNTWSNNVIALGLSSGFLEPMEATSILILIESLNRALETSNGFKNNNFDIRKKYNEELEKRFYDSVLFVYFHYLTDRTDTVFWKDFLKNHPPTPELTKYLNEMFQTFKDVEHIGKVSGRGPDGIGAWEGDFIKIYIGNFLFDRNMVNDYFHKKGKDKIINQIKSIKEYSDKRIEHYISSKDFINEIYSR